MTGTHISVKFLHYESPPLRFQKVWWQIKKYFRQFVYKLLVVTGLYKMLAFLWYREHLLDKNRLCVPLRGPPDRLISRSPREE